MKKTLLALIAISFITINACKKHDDDHDDHDHENELITSVELSFVDTLTNDTFTFEWDQPGGPGTAVSIDTIMLKPGKIYKAMVEFYDKSKTPIHDVTHKIEEAANEHRVVYTSSTERFSTKITDKDTQVPPMELGLTFDATTSIEGDEKGTLRVVLRHYTTNSPKAGGINNGTSDIDVTFPLMVK